MRKKEPKRDLRDGMWEQPPAQNAFGEDRPERQSSPRIASPNRQLHAEGQTTHE